MKDVLTGETKTGRRGPHAARPPCHRRRSLLILGRARLTTAAAGLTGRGRCSMMCGRRAIYWTEPVTAATTVWADSCISWCGAITGPTCLPTSFLVQFTTQRSTCRNFHRATHKQSAVPACPSVQLIITIQHTWYSKTLQSR